MGSPSPLGSEDFRHRPISTVTRGPSDGTPPPISALFSDELIVPAHHPRTEVALLPGAVDISAKSSARNVGCEICRAGIRPRNICHKPGHSKRPPAILGPGHVKSGEVQSVLLLDRKIQIGKQEGAIH